MKYRRASYLRLLRSGVALCFLLVIGVNCHDLPARTPAFAVSSSIAIVSASAELNRQDERQRLAASDPLAFLKTCRQHYFEHVADYRCLFTKRERIRGKLSDEQRIDIRYRESPYSVDMRWISSPRRANRVSYVAGRWVDGGRELALIEPSGVLGMLVPGGVRRDIHGEEVMAESRRSIDQFGFRNSLDLIIKYCEKAKGDPAFSLRYLGEGSLDDRPSYVFERRLPYTVEGGPYPDRVLLVYIDHEWLVPTGCLAYADHQRQELLGSYLLTDVQFNTGLTGTDF